MHIANDPRLIAGDGEKIDVVIAEVKSGTDDTPNSIWKKGVSSYAIEYIVRFVGLHDECEITDVANALASTFRFEDDKHRLRYVVFAHESNGHYTFKGVIYIKFRDVIAFLVDVRGQSWINCNLGVASSHPQWDDVLTKVFSIANKHELPADERIECIDLWLRAEMPDGR